jgi:type I restriction-modification enzyme s subunit
MEENTKSENVKWKTLKEICKISTGKLNANAKVENGEYPFFTCQKVPNKIDKYSFDTEAVLMAGNGNVGNVHYYSGKFDAYQRTYIIETLEVNVKFLYYYLKTFFKGYIENYKKEGIISYITLPVLEKFLVTLPPLKKQEEIAAVLDKFTELTEELTARETQYNYYRDMLLSEDYLNKILPKKNLIKKQLNEIAKLKMGKRLVRKELEKEGKYPVFQNSLTPLGYYNRKNNDGGKTCIISAGSAGEIFYQKKDFWAADDVFVIVSDSVLNKYLYYYLINKQNLIKTNIRKGTISRLPKEVLENLEILIPPIEIQNEIVNILDNFETLVNDIKQGLPREIELRQKQYEYYREKLLTFN